MPHQLRPAPGYTYEGIHGQSTGPHMLVGNGITLGFAIIAVVLRAVVKLLITPSLGWEDYFSIGALVLSIGRTIMLTIMTKRHQFGQHIWDIDLSNFGFQYIWAKGVLIIYLAAIACAKVSILLLYVRLFGVNRRFRYLCLSLMALVIGYCTATALAEIFQCRPVHAGWDFFEPGHCASLQEIDVAIGALNIVTDAAIVVAPMPIVLSLQLRPAKTIGVLAILATGLFVVAVAIIREVEVVRSPSHYDSTWNNGTKTLWLSIELNVGIMCTCFPVLSALGRKLPSMKYFKEQYISAMSSMRKSRRISHLVSRSTAIQDDQLGSNERDYIELKEAGFGTKAGVGKVRELDSMAEATIYGQ